MKQIGFVTVLASTVFLAACSSDAPKQSEESTASGEVLEASVSDAMIPLESVRSQAKLAPPMPGTATRDGAATGTSTAKGDTAAMDTAAGASDAASSEPASSSTASTAAPSAAATPQP